jgi:hypothetical protein
MAKLFLLFFIIPCAAFSQIALKIQLLDSITKKPIEFVNVGVLSKGIGTVSNENGLFQLNLPDSLKENELKFSCIGYESKKIIIKKLVGLNTLLIKPSAINLAEIKVVVKRNPKYKTLGNDTKTKSIIAGFTSNNLGSELAVKLNIKHKETKLKNLKFNIVSNPFDSLVFRFNVYNTDANGKPSKNILTQMVLIEPASKTGFVEFDLDKYNIYTSEDIFIAIEWIKDYGDNKGLFFSSQLLGGGSYFRKASQDKWIKVPAVGIGLSALVEY